MQSSPGHNTLTRVFGDWWVLQSMSFSNGKTCHILSSAPSFSQYSDFIFRPQSLNINSLESTLQPGWCQKAQIMSMYAESSRTSMPSTGLGNKCRLGRLSAIFFCSVCGNQVNKWAETPKMAWLKQMLWEHQRQVYVNQFTKQNKKQKKEKEEYFLILLGTWKAPCLFSTLFTIAKATSEWIHFQGTAMQTGRTGLNITGLHWLTIC